MRNLIILFSILVVSCGGGGSNSNTPPPRPPGTVDGTAFDGLIRNGTVNIYAFNGSKGALLGTTNTNSDGEYSLSITQVSQPILIEVTGGNYTEEATGSTVSLQLNVDFLRAVTRYTSGETVSMSVTYYTTLATGLAEYLVSAGSPVNDAINTANARMSALVGVDITTVVPVDITLLSNAKPNLDDPLRYGFATAAISELTKQQSSIAFPANPTHDLHNSIKWAGIAYNDIRHDGILDAKGVAGSLSIGSLPVVTDMYRGETAIAMLVIASNPNNQTSITSTDLRTLADVMAASTDLIFGGAAPSPIFDASDNPQINYAGSSNLIGVMPIAPQVVLSNGVALRSANLTIGGVDFGAPANLVSLAWSVDTTAIADGTHSMVVTATDVLSRTGTYTQDVVVNNGDINIALFPIPDTHVRGSVEVIVTPQTVTGLTITEVAIVDSTATIQLPDNGDGTWRYTLNTTGLPDGLQTLTVRATDSAARYTAIAYPLVVDNTLPSVTSSVTDDWVEGQITVSVNIVEANLPSPVDLTLDGNSIASLSAGASDVDIDTALLPDGSHTLALVAIDQAGNRTDFNQALRVDNTAPVITETIPADWVAGSTQFNITVTEVNLANASYTIDDGASVPLSAGSNTINIPAGTLSDGNHAIAIIAIDGAGLSATVNRTLQVDNTAPVIDSDLDTGWKRGSVLVTVSLTEGNLASATANVDGAQVGVINVGSTGVTINTAVYSDGPHTFEVVATDGAGTSTTYTQTLNTDNTAPVISIGFPLNGGIVGGNFTYRGTIQEEASGLDFSSEQVFVDGVQIDTAGLICSAPTGTAITCTKTDASTNYSDGPHTVQFRASDIAGNAGASSVINVQFDNVPPSLSGTQNLGVTVKRYSYSDAGAGVPAPGYVDVGYSTSALGNQECPPGETGNISIRTYSFTGPVVSDLAGNSVRLASTTTIETIFNDCTSSPGE